MIVLTTHLIYVVMAILEAYSDLEGIVIKLVFASVLGLAEYFG
jgi:hypothetical protein